MPASMLGFLVGIDDVALRRIKSYLSDRSEFVRIGTVFQHRRYLISYYLKDRSLDLSFLPFIPRRWRKLPMRTKLYSSNTQTIRKLYIAMSKTSSANAIIQPQNCVTALHKWFAENGLALHPDKSEAVLFSTAQCTKELSAISTVDAVESTIDLSSRIKLLGVTLDANLNFNDQVRNVCNASLFHIRAQRHLRHSLTEEMANVIACALVQSRIEYANSLYTCMSSANFDKLQLVQNTIARVVTLTRKRDNLQP